MPASSACVFNIPSTVMGTSTANTIVFPGTNAAVTVGLSIGTLGKDGTLSELHTPGGSRAGEILAATMLPAMALLLGWSRRKRQMMPRRWRC